MQSAATVWAPIERICHHLRVYARAAERRKSGWIGATFKRTMSRTKRNWSGPHRPSSSQARTRYSSSGEVARSGYSVTHLRYVRRRMVVPSDFLIYLGAIAADSGRSEVFLQASYPGLEKPAAKRTCSERANFRQLRASKVWSRRVRGLTCKRNKCG